MSHSSYTSSSLTTFIGPREFRVADVTDSEVSSRDSESSEEEIEKIRPRFDSVPEYWPIMKLVKYMKTGNPTATIVALCCLKDFNLNAEVNQYTIQENGGLEVLINLLETNDLNCKVGALHILIILAANEDLRKCMVDLGIIPLLVKNLADPAGDLQILATETIYHVAQIKKGRKDLRHSGGLPILVDLLDVQDVYLQTPRENLDLDGNEYVDIARSASRALLSASKSKENVFLMMKVGFVSLLTRLVRSVHIDVVMPIVGTLSLCTVLPAYQLAVRTEGLVKDIVKRLLEPATMELQTYCCQTIFLCADDASTRDMVREAGGLDPLINIAKNQEARSNKNLLAAVTGAIWKTAKTQENVERYDKLRAVDILVRLLDNVDEDERVLSNVVGALAEFTKFPHNRESLRRAGGIQCLVILLNETYPPLLENLGMVLRECAQEEDSMAVLEEFDGVRLLWSLLKNPCKNVQANAAWALVPCIRYASDSGEMVRSFVGGLELTVNLLKSDDNHVLACVCASIAEIAKDIENLAIITDHGVVPLLVNLVPTEDEQLREHLASAIAFCCAWGTNCKMFGRLGAITPLVGFMGANNPDVQRTTALALYHLSENAFNCITMHESGVVPFLLKAVGSIDHELQDAAAGCLANVRKLALEAETTHLVRRVQVSSSSDEGE